MTDEQEYQWGVVYEGRDLGFIPYDSEQEARWNVEQAEDKYAPAHLARRRVGPVEFVDGPGGCNYVLPFRSRNYECANLSGHDGDHRFVFPG